MRPWDLRAQRLQHGRIRKQRTTGVMLDPLTEVGIGMLMPILIGRGQFVVDFQRNRKGSQGQQQADQRQRQRRFQKTAGERFYQRTVHDDLTCNKQLVSCQLPASSSLSLLNRDAACYDLRRIAYADRHTHAPG
jgi:hypothetical protein